MTLIVSPDTLVPRPGNRGAGRACPAANTTSTEKFCGTRPGYRRRRHCTGDREGTILSATLRPPTSAKLRSALRRENANRHALPNVEFLSGDWTAPVSGRTFDLIVSNPPYVPGAHPDLERLGYEPQMALVSGEDGLDAIRRISVEAKSIIRQGGTLLIEHGDSQQEEIARILSADGWSRISHVNDLAGKPRVTIASA